MSAVPHGPGEAVLGIIRDAHGVVDVVERDDREHRTEDLLLRDAHVVGDAGEHRRLHVPALVQAGGAAVAADLDLGAFFLAERDVLLDPLLLALRDQRADLRRRVVRVAHLQAADHLGQRAHDLVVPAA